MSKINPDVSGLKLEDKKVEFERTVQGTHVTLVATDKEHYVNQAAKHGISKATLKEVETFSKQYLTDSVREAAGVLKKEFAKSGVKTASIALPYTTNGNGHVTVLGDKESNIRDVKSNTVTVQPSFRVVIKNPAGVPTKTVIKQLKNDLAGK